MPSTKPGSRQLKTERLAGSAGVSAELVLLSGWSMDSRVWRGLLPRLRKMAHITLLDLYSWGPEPQLDTDCWREENLLEAILQVVPGQAVYLGWSLGGNIALALAAHAPGRVRAVLTLACNPCFVAREGWPAGMPESDFLNFQTLVRRRGQASLSRFDALQCSGGSRERDSLRWCRNWRRQGSAVAGLEQSLELLDRLDVRDRLAGLPQPVRHLLGERDQLVPAALEKNLLESNPSQQVTVVPDCNHLLPLNAGDEVCHDLQLLLEQVGARPARELSDQRDKLEVARSFSNAAATYNSVAELQRQVGGELLQRWPQGRRDRQILDLGCGTGYFRPHLSGANPGAQYLGLDIAEGMVRYASSGADAEDGHWLVGDAEDLPLVSCSVDSVFSSLSVQWSEQLPRLFGEVKRVLRPGGLFLFSTLGPDTLWELRESWAAADCHRHVNRFTPLADIEAALHEAGLVIRDLECCPRVLHYERALDLLRELKALGAHNVNSERAPGLTGRRQMQAMQEAYEQLRSDGTLPASYEVIYAVVYKSDG